VLLWTCPVQILKSPDVFLHPFHIIFSLKELSKVSLLLSKSTLKMVKAKTQRAAFLANIPPGQRDKKFSQLCNL